MKRFMSIILCLSVLLTLCGCGIDDTREEKEHVREKIEKEFDEYLDEAVDSAYQAVEDALNETQPPEETDSLDKKVIMTDITFAPIDMYSASVDFYDPKQGYVIQATVSNRNDVCCDIFPKFSVEVTQKDNYGDEQVSSALLTNVADIYTPYGPEYLLLGSEYLEPVGLAPHETKTIRYYIEPNTGIISMANIQLLALVAQEASQIYVPVAQWGESIWLEEVDESMVGLSMYKNYVHGTIENHTEDRWKSVTVQADFSINGQALYESVINRARKTFSYVKIGGTVSYTDSAGDGVHIASYEVDEYQMEMIPSLLAYTPDENA